MTHRLVLCLCLALFAACGNGNEQSFDVGEHHVRLAVPAGWERVDQGRQVLLRHESDQLIFTDLGPSHPEGFRAEIERARKLWSDGRYREAMTRLDQLPQGKELFARESDHTAFREAWGGVAYSPKDSPWSAVDAQFQHLLKVVDTMKPASIEAIAKGAAERLEHLDHRRELKTTETRSVDGRQAALVATWMTLTHDNVRVLLLVVNDGRSLALRCDRCNEPVRSAFDKVAESLHFGSGERR